ncbi:MAG: hypothetical protein A2535_04855 [Burkholderiales bacterium RIFOXYD2_FULL_59_8]|nr:MAG: hypothetical protein A2535_04855 [Burkholderiales bacterium RIFOXYD2_FULL_59_8]
MASAVSAGPCQAIQTHTPARSPDPGEQLAEPGRLPYEVLESLEPGTSMGGARPKVTVEDGRRLYLAKLPEKQDKHATAATTPRTSLSC